MRYATRLTLTMGLVVTLACLAFSTVLYLAQKRALLDGIDSQLLTAAACARSILPEDYHDRILGPGSISPDEFDRIVDRNNRLCLRLDLQYLWSCMLVDGRVVFTSATSPGKDVLKHDHAKFFEMHKDPEAFARAFSTMQVDYSSFRNEWGHGRMVLVPFHDRHGRKCCFGASISVDDAYAVLHRTLVGTVLLSTALLLLGLFATALAARSFARPIARLTVAAQRIAKGNLESAVAVAGTTEIARLSQGLNDMREAIRDRIVELEQRNEEMARFSYTVSHDLKSPLVTIKAFLGYLEQDLRSQDAGQVGKDMAYIRNAADKMGTLLDELLELSRVGRKVSPPVEASLREIAGEAVELIAGAVAERGVSIRISAEPFVLFGDRRRLVEVFQNLLDNAVKFMGDQPKPRVDVGAEVVDGEVVCYVRDNGMGVDPRHQGKLFGLFEKLDPESQGTGIGLTLVKRIVELHGGRIWVESPGPGEGTTFRFTLANARQADDGPSRAEGEGI